MTTVDIDQSHDLEDDDIHSLSPEPNTTPAPVHLPSFHELDRVCSYNLPIPSLAADGSGGGKPSQFTAPPLFIDYTRHNVARRVGGQNDSTINSVTAANTSSSRSSSPGLPQESPSDDTPDHSVSSPLNWEMYSTPHPTPQGGPTLYRCLWPSSVAGSDRVCGYCAKKQLVKRHVETTHLKLKPHICEYCGKAFPQKTSLDIHRSSHDGTRPHACQMGCNERFKDPARRHRHHVEQHNYVPRQARRNPRVQVG